MTREIDKAVEALRAGKPVVFPTDTVYGLGVSVEHARTPRALYEIKKRDAGKPVAWLVSGPGALDVYGADVPDEARSLAAAHWPGALTIIVKASSAVPEAFISAQGTVGLRMPDNSTALALIEAVGSPLATTSANLSGGDAPQSFAEIDEAVLDAAAIAVEGASPASGVPSTVLDCSRGAITVLRKGDIAL